MLLPTFPEFKPIELSDRNDLEVILSKYPPYSDFNFTSMYTYHTAEASILNDNLVIKFSDYVDNTPFYSFIGVTKTDQTAIILLDSLLHQNIDSPLQLIPEICITPELKNNPNLSFSEDPNNFDYILSVDNLANLSKIHYNKTKHFTNFQLNYPTHIVREIDLTNPAIQSEIVAVFDEWKTSRERSENETYRERTAIIKAFESAAFLPLLSLGIFLNDNLIGFSICDLFNSESAEFHFVKASIKYKGIFAALYIYVAQFLKERGVKYMNIEQDLGIAGLRNAKKQWHPISYLKKYKISKSSTQK